MNDRVRMIGWDWYFLKMKGPSQSGPTCGPHSEVSMELTHRITTISMATGMLSTNQLKETYLPNKVQSVVRINCVASSNKGLIPMPGTVVFGLALVAHIRDHISWEDSIPLSSSIGQPFPYPIVGSSYQICRGPYKHLR